MAGRKGMHHKKPAQDALRRRLWRAMRILGKFTLPDLLRIVPGASYGNSRKFVANLTRHGYVVKNGGYVGGRAGENQGFRLVKNIGPDYPTICDVCGKSLSFFCGTTPKKETDKETEETGEVNHDQA